ncbi:MAG TPA: prepilin-type N-terminal cleavage/methylation domain-containing protein [Gemmatimonadales bacterium]|nr:prepilin-type N-terminal cleavage/methylation domain-containing protein [Gemmatimonadales bacterium]
MNRKGFTLIELLIVVVIIGILAAIAIPKFATTKDKAKLASVKTDIRNYMTAQEAYQSDNPLIGYAAAAATLQAAPYNFSFSAGNVATASAGAANGYSITVQNASISTGTNSCQVTVGMGAAAAVDGVIQCP